MIRVLLVVPSPALRAGVRSLLAADTEIRVVGECSRWDEAQDLQNEADVAIATSASLSRLNLSQAELPASLPVLFLGDEPPSSTQRLAAWGALPHETTAEELSAAVRALAQGLVAGTSQLLFGPQEQDGSGSPLTEREAEVLRWLARGLANKQIAAELGISEHTVKFHVSSIYTKLNATNRAQAVREGLRNGWIPL